MKKIAVGLLILSGLVFFWALTGRVVMLLVDATDRLDVLMLGLGFIAALALAIVSTLAIAYILGDVSEQSRIADAASRSPR